MPNVRPDVRAPRPGGSSFLEEDSNGWLVTFSDLVLQLFAFVLVAAVLGPGSAHTLERREPARVRPRIATPAERPVPADALSLARFDDLPPRAPEAPAPVEEPPRSIEPVAAVPAPVVEPPPATSLAAELEASLTDAGLADVVQVAVNGGGVTLSISDTIGFASGRAELLPDATPMLAAVRRLVGVRPELAIEVAGHTDDTPLHGGAFGSNLELSLARAARVARELAAGDAALAARIFASGYGEQRPLVPNVDAESRARNRRVEIRLVPRGEA